MARKKSSRTKKRPRTGALENKVDAVLLSHGLSLDEDPEKLLEKSKRRQSKFQPGNPGRRKKKTSKSTATSKRSASKRKTSSASKKSAPKKKSSSKRKKSSSKKKGKRKLTKKEIEQRKYAAKMKGVRKRAEETEGGTGPILEREAAKKLRKKHGLKNPRNK